MYKPIKYVLLILAVSFMTTGCWTIPSRPDTVIKYKLVKPSENMLAKCKVTPPPKQADYVASTATQKETYLFNLSTDLYADLKTCNSYWDTLKQWYVEQDKIYNK